MDTQQLLSHIIDDMAQALCQRRDEPHLRQAARAEAAAQSILSFQPADAVEAMIAGRCVMFHELIVDSVQTGLRGEFDGTGTGIVAMDRAFGANLARLQKYRAHQAGSIEVATSADARTETEIADRLHRHQSGAASTASQSEAASAADNASPEDAPSAGIITEAVRPLDAIQIARLPHASSVDRPRDVYPATVTQMPALNRQARREIGRKTRKGIDTGTSPIENAKFGRKIRP